MSTFHKKLRDFLVTNFMSMSVNREPVKDIISVTESEPTEPILGNRLTDDEPEKVLEKSDKYHYLLDDPLSREFSLDRDITKPIIIHLCMYKINNVLEHPFLEFYLEKNNAEFTFPNKILPSKLFEDFIENDESGIRIEPAEITTKESDYDIEEFFLEQCFDYFKEMTGSPEFDENCYKGFVEIDNDICVVFDCTNLFINQLPGTWTILDEILIKKTLFNMTISPLVINMFINNKIMMNIKNDYDENIYIPKVLYLCKKIDDELIENVYYNSNENSQTTISLVHDRIYNEKLKDIYLFSETILTSANSVLRIKRYAVFTDENNKIIGELSLENEKIPEKSIIGFQEKGINYWCTKSPEYFAEI
jgi:hypothetical protein